jgi:hypothetical protein
MDADVDTPRDSSDALAPPALAPQEANTSAPAAAAANGHLRHPPRRDSPAPPPAGPQPAANGSHGVTDASGGVASAQNGAPHHGPRMNGLHQRRESAGDSRSIESRGGTAGESAESGAEDAASSAESRRLQELRIRWDDLLAQARLHFVPLALPPTQTLVLIQALVLPRKTLFPVWHLTQASFRALSLT